MGARRAEKKGIPEETFKKFASFAKGLDSYNVKTYKAVGKFLSSLPPKQRKFFAPKKGEHEAYLRGDLDYNYSNID